MAALLFLTLSYFALFLFTKSGGDPTPAKLVRNRIYRFCGVVMLACIAGIGIYHAFLDHTALSRLNPVFWLETFALWSFGISWFIKGETLWTDEQPDPA